MQWLQAKVEGGREAGAHLRADAAAAYAAILENYALQL